MRPTSEILLDARLTLRGHITLAAIGSPLLPGGAAREPAPSDIIAAWLVMSGDEIDAARVLRLSETLSQEQFDAITADVAREMSDLANLLQAFAGGGAKRKGGKPAQSDGFEASVLLDAANNWGWTPDQTLGVKLAHLLILSHERAVRAGSAASYSAIETARAIAAKRKAASDEEPKA